MVVGDVYRAPLICFRSASMRYASSSRPMARNAHAAQVGGRPDCRRPELARGCNERLALFRPAELPLGCADMEIREPLFGIELDGLLRKGDRGVVVLLAVAQVRETLQIPCGKPVGFHRMLQCTAASSNRPRGRRSSSA